MNNLFWFQMMMLSICIMLSIAFYTLLERKVLGLTHMRLGPNKTSLGGLMQPVMDGFKLFKKMNNNNYKVYYYYYLMITIFMFIMSFILWTCYPFKFWVNKSLSFAWILLLIGLLSFCILITGWSSSSKYSMLGSIRSISQVISLEILIIIVMLLWFFIFSKSILHLKEDTFYTSSYIFMASFFFIILMETQRTPFDTSESESELISGYNTEYHSILFTLIFLSEYSSILLFSGLMINIFIPNFQVLWLSSMTLMLTTRACFPRIRYDFLMEYSWFKMTPLLISVSIFVLNLKFL